MFVSHDYNFIQKSPVWYFAQEKLSLLSKNIVGTLTSCRNKVLMIPYLSSVDSLSKHNISLSNIVGTLTSCRNKVLMIPYLSSEKQKSFKCRQKFLLNLFSGDIDF